MPVTIHSRLHEAMCRLALAVTLLGIGFNAMAQGLVVFGDSLSDTGLVWQRLAETSGKNLPVSPPYARGRFSDGPVAVEYMAQTLGTTLENHAWGGATTGEDNILDEGGELAHTGVTAQVRQYLQGRGVADPAALYLLWAGGNDLIFAPDQATSAQASEHLLQAVGALHEAGARHFLIPLMPDLSVLPLLHRTEDAGRYHDVSVDFNARLSQGVAALQSRYADATWLSFDTPAFIAGLIGNGAVAGLDNTDQACIQGSFSKVQAVCATPSSHVFWDSSHFTTGVHARLGQALAAAVVPEPASAAHMLWGLGGLLCLIRRERLRRTCAAARPDQLE